MHVYVIHDPAQQQRKKHLLHIILQLHLPTPTFITPLSATTNAQSHHKTYKHVLERGARDSERSHEPVLILEDDVRPMFQLERTRTELARQLALPYTALYLETCHNACKLTDAALSPHTGQCTAAIVYKDARVCRDLLALLATEDEREPIDETLLRLGRQGRWASQIAVPLFFQDVARFGSHIAGSSTLQQRYSCRERPRSSRWFRAMEPYLLETGGNCVFFEECDKGGLSVWSVRSGVVVTGIVLCSVGILLVLYASVNEFNSKYK